MEQMSSPVLLEHLFRRQAGRIVSSLAGLLGSKHLQLAEDAVQEAMLRAAQRWPFQGVPENPDYFERSIVGEEISVRHVQAAIAATYAKAESWETIDWRAILEHYDQLMEMTGSPVVALNRAVAVIKVHGAEAALAALAPVADHPAVRGYHLLPAVRGRVLAELGQFAEAEAAFSAALACDCTEPEKRFLRKQ